eukprot:jgi/Chlat1/6324/Chrsp44S05895
MGRKKLRGKEGNATLYTTRNQALTRLQIKLPEFRRLCILKGIHPREPKKKVHGQHKTYYHVKDINFLAHEPLLEKSRELKVYDRKIKKAEGKEAWAVAERLRSRRPTFSLDHLVKERYPSFIDAVRDMDDPLTLVHLFAVLPAERRHHIPADMVHTARRLALEFQAYVTRTHALRKVFVSVKGIYFQAEVLGQTITWIAPHALGQHLPDDVDYRVMLTFLEFYEVLLGFIMYKLYHSLGVAYPPVLDEKLEQAAAGLSAVMMQLAKPEAITNQETTTEALPDAAQDERARQESQERMASLTEKLAAVDRALQSDAAERPAQEGEEAPVASTSQETADNCLLFSGLVFFLAREVPREALLFVIRAFGGTVGWQGEGSPFDESDTSITHQVVDRPTQGHRYLSRQYVQPQWAFDSVNQKFLLPVDAYLPGCVPPPHLSPFINDEDEGYTPDYAETVRRLRSGAEAVGAVTGAVVPVEDAEDNLATATAAMDKSEELAVAAQQAELAAQETKYIVDLASELAGVPFSASLQRENGAELPVTEPDEEEEDTPTTAEPMLPSAVKPGNDEAALAQIMMPRKAKKLYDAMQRGKSIKRDHIERLKERKRQLEQSRKRSGDSGKKARKTAQ